VRHRPKVTEADKSHTSQSENKIQSSPTLSRDIMVRGLCRYTTCQYFAFMASIFQGWEKPDFLWKEFGLMVLILKKQFDAKKTRFY
jgi:hypothetical protein